ncbi:MAG: acylneuraminate cytidylyltransferase family protein [Flavobacteriaceae bacterium]
MNKTVAIIPARGGSKRIPKKNIIDFMGKPMIYWTIKAAMDSKVFDRIILTTDSEEIAQVGRDCGLDVPFLRQNKNDDISPVSEATIEAIKQAEEYYKESYDTVIQLMANAPLRKGHEIKEHYQSFTENKRDFQLSSFKFGWMNPWWAAKLKEDNSPEWMFPEGITKRSQDLDDLYCPTGVIWIADVEKLKGSNTFYGPNYKFCEINWKSAVDIDDYEDLEFAKALFLLETNNGEKKI